MTSGAHLALADQPLAKLPRVSLGTLDTTVGSILHHRSVNLDGATPGGAFAVLKLYLGAVVLTFLPLLAAALITSLITPVSLTVPGGPLRLPFFYDWNTLFLVLVSFPCLVVLTVTDHQALTRALRSVQSDGTVTTSEPDEIQIANRWKGLFCTANLAGQSLGIIVGAIVAYFNFVAYTPASVGFWIAQNGRLLPVGFVFLYCIFLFYALVPLYVIRNIAISMLLRDIVAHSKLHMLPLHPDKCGGLRPVGQLGLRNQYALTLFGLNVVLLVTISLTYLDVPESLTGLIVAAVIAYLILGPLVFMGPLLPFRGGMLRNKAQLMGEVALRLRVELDRLRQQLPQGVISEEDEQLIGRLRKIGAVIDELPVWPFDSGTLRKFLTAYIIPIISSAGFPLAKFLLGLVKVQIPG
jgi:hypothetical protein